MPVLIVVEGPQDAHTIEKMLNDRLTDSERVCGWYRGLDSQTKPFTLRSAGGYENLLKELPSILAGHEGPIGFVVDADSDIGRRWTSLTDRLKLSEDIAHVPEAPDANGTLLHAVDSRWIGIWLWPNNRDDGDLETFASTMIPGEDLLWPHACETVAELGERRVFAENHENKAKLYTWLAWQKPPGQQVGDAIRRHALNPDSPLAQSLKVWLHQLKDLDT